jgi:hypothetical protein
MINGNFAVFGLGAHCDGSCNEAAVWYNEIVNHRLNFYTR